MIDTENFFNNLLEENVEFFAGVPDSLLKNICSYITENTSSKNHTIAANEGNALALGIGYHLASGKLPLIYMQNSGLSNALNPLISIAHQKVYSIPLILIIGWRGSPRVKDEPQHNVKGKITRDILKLLGIKLI